MNRPIRCTLVALWLVVTGASLVLAPRPAPAQQVDSELEEMLDQAVEDYDMLQLDESMQTLDEAISMGESEGASSTTLARLYVIRAIVEHAQSQDEEAIEEDFIRALEHDPKITIPAHYKNPTLTELFEEAKQKVPDEDAARKGSEATEDDFEHEPVETAPAGEPLEIETKVAAKLPVYRVYGYYRRYGENEFQRVELEATSATRFAVELPGQKVRTSQLEYYIEAIDRAGEVLARAGDDASPHQVTLLGSSGERIAEPDQSGEASDESLGEASAHSFYLMLGGGSGVGFLPGGSPTAHPDRPVSGGLAPAFGHSIFDAGYMISEDVHIGLYFRWQFSPPQDFTEVPTQSKEGGGLSSKAECLGLGLPGDCLLGAKYRWFFKNDSDLRMYSSTGVGIGRVRSWLRLKEPYYDDQGDVTPICSNKDRVEESGAEEFCYVRDTVRPGWAHFGVGAGVMWPIRDSLDVGFDSYLTVLMPETAVNLDVNLAMNFRF